MCEKKTSPKMVEDKMFVWFDRLFTTVGLCSVAKKEENSFSARFGQFCGYLILLFNLFTLDLSSGIYMWEQIKINDLENILYALIQSGATTCGILSVISIAMHKKKVRKMFDRIQYVVDNGYY